MIRAALVSILLLLLSACSRTEQVETLTGFAQGTTWHVTVWQPGGVDLNTLQKHIDAEFSRLDTVLSNYRADSDIERFNRSETTALVEVGEEIVTLVRTARTISEASQGCYDLTIKPLFDLWGFTGDTLTPPSPDVLAQVRQHIGFSKLSSPSGNLLQKSDPKLRVDLSSIAQGYSVSRIAAVVEAAGIQNYLVEIGGELQTRGHKPDGSPWRIGVERPLPEGRSVEKALTIGRDTPTAVMTSGTYRHYFDEQGQRYSHILDARTGRPGPIIPSLSPLCMIIPPRRMPGPPPCSASAVVTASRWQSSRVLPHFSSILKVDNYRKCQPPPGEHLKNSISR